MVVIAGKNKLLVCFLLITSIFTVFSGCGKKHLPESTEHKIIAIRLAEGHPPGYPTTEGVMEFARLVDERSQGLIKIVVYHSSQLGEEKTVIEKIKQGNLEMARVNVAPLAAADKQLGFLSLPYLFDSDEHLWTFLDGQPGTRILDGLYAYNIKGLTYYDSGVRSFYSAVPIRTVNDLRGMNIRVQQNQINADMIKALGANPRLLPYNEVLNAFKDGSIDAAENNYASFYSSQHFQIAKYMLLDRHQRTPDILIAGKTFWDKLSPQNQELIKQAAVDSAKFQREAWKKYDQDAEGKLRSAGVVITEVANIKDWQNAVKPVIEQYRTEYKELLEAVEATR